MMPPRQIAAFFDLDGTLLEAPSLEWRFIAWLAARDHIDGSHMARWLGHCARNIWRDPHEAIFGNKFYLEGLSESLTGDWESSLDPDSLRFARLGAERVRWHQAHGHRVFLVSGALAPLVRAAARRLTGPIEVCASELEASGGRWTGRLAGEPVRGEAKAEAVLRLAARHKLDLAESYAYGNCLADLPMLESVGHAVAVNPGAGLERIACSKDENRNWHICVWSKPERLAIEGDTDARPRRTESSRQGRP